MVEERPEKRALLTGHSVPGLGDRSFRKVISGDVVDDREHDRGRWSRRSAMSGASANVSAKQPWKVARKQRKDPFVERSTASSRALVNMH